MDVTRTLNGLHAASQVNATQAQSQKDPRLWKAVKDFESILVYQMLKSMRETISQSGLTDAAPGKEFFESIFDQEIAKSMAGREYGSLADILYRQLSNETTTEPPKEPVPIPRLSTNAIAAHADSETTENITVQTDIPEFSKPEAPNITAPVIKIDDNESAETITPHVTTPQIPEVKPIKKVRLPEYRMQTLTDPKPVFKAAQKAYSTQSLPDRLRQFQEIVDQAAEKYNIDRNLIFAVIAQESYGNPNDVSSKGAKGLMQLMDETATDMGVRNVMDPRENVMGGTKYLSQLLSQYDGDLELTLAGYNAGPGNVRKYGGIPPFQETQQYVKKVLAYYKQFKGTTSL